MLRFEGDRDFSQSPAELFAKLTDARFLVTCLPDVEKVSEQEADRAVLTLRPGLSFARQSGNDVANCREDAADRRANAADQQRHRQRQQGGSDADADAERRRARVHWIAEVKELSGLLKMVPQGLIRGAAEKVLNDAWAAVETKLRS